MNIQTEKTECGYYAYDADDYCGCGECACPIGGGLTEQQAIEDLLEQMDREPNG